MGRWGIASGSAAAAVLLAVTLIPLTEAGHCDTRITMFGRSALGPGIVPPRLPTGQACPEIESTNAPGHSLPPATDQIFVRAEVDLGTSYPVVLLFLEGQGFRNQQFTLTRTVNALGGVTYVPEDWLSIPDLEANDGITATVRYPGSRASVHYSMSSLPITST